MESQTWCSMKESPNDVAKDCYYIIANFYISQPDLYNAVAMKFTEIRVSTQQRWHKSFSYTMYRSPPVGHTANTLLYKIWHTVHMLVRSLKTCITHIVILIQRIFSQYAL